MENPAVAAFGPANTSPFQARNSFAHEGIEHSVFTAGTGPGVLLMHELPGMTPEFWRLANWLAEHFTVWAPDLFGNREAPTSPGLAKLTFRACISREIHLFAEDDPGPVTQWLRALSRQLHDAVGGPGIGTIGMCMTGNFALTLALDPWVVAPVTSQPGLPANLPWRNQDGGLQMKPEEKAALREQDTAAMGMRFAGDELCKAARFDAIRSIIGADRFSEHVLPDDARNPNGSLKHPHSVLTDDLVDADDSLTKQKLGEVVAFLKARIV